MRFFLGFLLIFFNANVEAQCNASLRPVIFIHGFLASGDTWSNALHFFQQAGYCPDRLFVLDWNSLGGNGKSNENLLAKYIDEVIIKTGSTQIDLVGHSAGGGLGRSFLRDSILSKKVAHYVHIGSRKWTSSYAWFPNENCLNIYSLGDRVAGNSAGLIEGAKNLALKDEDHYQVATSEASLKAMFEFFNDSQLPNPQQTSFKKVQIAGKAVLLGNNQPMSDAQVNIYPIDKKKGVRKNESATIQSKVSTSGAWGPVEVRHGVPYEIELIPADNKSRTISYFFPSFNYNDPLVYLRGFPEGNMMTSLLGKIPEQENQSVLVIYSSASAMIGGRDSVLVNGSPISSNLLTPASKTVITSFIFDDGDQLSSGNALKQFATAPFIGGVDLLLSADENKVIEIYYNGRTLHIPARPSKERILLAVLN